MQLKAKRIVKVVVFLLIPCMIIWGVDWWVDAYASGRVTYNKIGKILIDSNYYHGKDISLSERKVKWARMNQCGTRYNVIALGDSRISLLDQSMMGEEFYNFFTSGGCTTQDYYAEVYLLYAKDLLPNKMLIEVSPGLFNKNREEQRYQEWERYPEYMKNVLEGEEIKGRKANLGIQVNDFMSPSYFQYNFNLLKEKKRLTVYETDALELDDYTVFHSDGSMMYSKQYQDKYSEEDLVRITESQIAARSVYACEGFEGISPDFQDDFERLVDFLLEEGVEVEFYLPPYSPLLYDFIKNDDQYKRILDVEDYVLEYGEKKRLKVYGSYNPALCGLEISDLYDAGHVRREKMMDTFVER